MSQITIREIPPSLDAQLRALARAKNTSLNKTIQAVLMEALGISADGKKRRNLSDLSGSWSDEESIEFENNLKEFDSIDRELWD